MVSDLRNVQGMYTIGKLERKFLDTGETSYLDKATREAEFLVGQDMGSGNACMRGILRTLKRKKAEHGRLGNG